MKKDRFEPEIPEILTGVGKNYTVRGSGKTRSNLTIAFVFIRLRRDLGLASQLPYPLKGSQPVSTRCVTKVMHPSGRRRRQ
jgi:hypothetical protein